MSTNAEHKNTSRTKRTQAVSVSLKDMYQLLIAECRYGYSRNNHLMPFGAYEHVKEYLPQMFAIDEAFALSVAKQICEECISDELLIRFANRADDEFHNLRMSREFIQWLIDWITQHSVGKYISYMPYNYQHI